MSKKNIGSKVKNSTVVVRTIMREKPVQYKNLPDLESFLAEVEEILLAENNRKEVTYNSEDKMPWNSDNLLSENNMLFESISNKANVYALFTAEKDSEDYSLRYIGKTRRKLARTRLTNHLIKKHEKTGAKLSKVIDHVQAGGKVKISWVLITPESLRNYIEEELIEKHPESNWNEHARKSA